MYGAELRLEPAAASPRVSPLHQRQPTRAAAVAAGARRRSEAARREGDAYLSSVSGGLMLSRPRTRLPALDAPTSMESCCWACAAAASRSSELRREETSGLVRLAAHRRRREEAGLAARGRSGAGPGSAPRAAMEMGKK